MPLLLMMACSSESRAQRHLERGNELFERGDFEAARLEYLNVIRLRPTDAVAIRRVGTILQEQGAALLAVPYILRAAELEPGDVDLRVRAATASMSAGDVTNALKHAWAALDLDPKAEGAVLLVVEAPVPPGIDEPAQWIEELRQRLAAYHQKAGEAAVHHLAEAVFALRREERDPARALLERALALDDQLAPAHYMQGTFLEAAGDYTAADAAYRRAAELSPARSQRRVRYAEFKRRRGEIEAARAWLEAVVREAPDYVPAIAAQAELAFAERKVDDALRLAEAALGRYPLQLDAALLRSQIRITQGEAARAVEELGRIQQVYGRVPVFQYRLAVAQLANQEPNQALTTIQAVVETQPAYAEAVMLWAQLQLARGRAEEAIQPLRRLLEARPGFAPGQLLLADACLSSRRYDEALAIYRETAAGNPQDPRGPYRVGLVLRLQNKLDEAPREFERSLQVDPRFVPALAQLVELDMVSNDLAGAQRRVESMLAAAPETAAAHTLLARVHLARTNLGPAEVSLKRAIELDPNTPGAYQMLAGIYRAGDRLPQALEQLDRALEKSPRDVGLWLQKAAIHSGQGDSDQARLAYERILEIDPRSVVALNDLAYLHTEQRPDLEKAYAYARRARDAAPTAPAIADTLGWVRFHQGEYADALRLLQEAAEKLPDEPEVQYHLGMTYYMMAQEGSARAAFERALQSTAEFNGKDEARRRLAILTGIGVEGDTRRQLEAIVRDAPRDVFALMRLAHLQEQAGEAQAARASYEAALKQNPGLPQAMLGAARLMVNDPAQRAEALRLARRARDVDVTDGDVAWQAGQVAIACVEVPLALTLLQDASRRLPDRLEIVVDLALANAMAGRLTEATQLSQRVIQAGAPTNAVTKARELEWLIQAAQNPAAAAEKAEPQVVAMLNRNPASIPAQMAMAGVHRVKGRFDEAGGLYEQVLRAVPAHPQALRELTLLYADDLKDDRRAYEVAVRARQALAADPDVARVLGVLAYRRGDHRYAAQLLDEAARSLASNADVFYHLGMARVHLKQPKEAQEALTQALALGATASWRAEAQKTLENLQAP
jgi:tetratricopeptide (TPR) repeat protein